MLVYIISFSSALILSFFSFYKKDPLAKKTKLQLIFAILSAGSLFIITAFRYGIGNDYYTYAEYFVNSPKIHFLEFGFDFLLQIIHSFTNDFMWLFIVCSAIFFYFIYRAIYEQSINPTLSIFVFIFAPYFFEFFSGMREMMAVAIFLYSIKYIKGRKIVPYIILNLIGFSIHYSAIIFIPVYFLYNRKITFTKSMLILFVTLFFRRYIAKLLSLFIVTTEYSKYYDGQLYAGHFGIVTFIIPLFIFFFSVIFYNKKEDGKEDKNYQFYCNLMFIQLLIVLLQDLIPLITRIGWGFGASQIILIPYAISKIQSPKNKFYMIVIVCVLFILYMYNMRFSGDGGTLLPFRWIFNR